MQLRDSQRKYDAFREEQEYYLEQSRMDEEAQIRRDIADRDRAHAEMARDEATYTQEVRPVIEATTFLNQALNVQKQVLEELIKGRPLSEIINPDLTEPLTGDVQEVGKGVIGELLILLSKLVVKPAEEAGTILQRSLLPESDLQAPQEG